MNNDGYYQNPIFSQPPLNNSIIPNQENFDYTADDNIENLLKLNIGKKGKFYVTIPNSNEWQSKIFEGIIECVGDDYLIISNPNGEWYLLLTTYINFIVFEERINFVKV